ncbi:MAG TPA: MFS transporter [Baekduia sp.]|nr:MFS transporter [Baekduia sp.]
MYQVQDSVALLRARRSFAAARRSGRPFVARTVLLLGLTSLFTDVSSEMVSAILPLYTVHVLGLNPFQYGVLNGIYQGGSAFARLIFGFVADRMNRYREVAGVGYGLSAICKLGLLATTAFGGIAAVLLIDRIGKGIRTAPRDAMISLSSPQEELGTAFGVHRAMDTCGAMLGPLLGFALLAMTPNEYHGIFLISFCFALIGVAILLLLVDDPARDRQRAQTANAPVEPIDATPAVAPQDAVTTPDPVDSRLTLRGAWGLLGGTPLSGLVLIAFLLGLATIGDAFLYLQLDDRLDLADSLFPLLYVGTSSIFMVMAVPAGRLSDRIGRAKVFTFGYAILLALYAILLSGARGDLLLPATVLGLGIFYACTDGVLAALGSAAVPEGVRGTGLAALGTATGLAQFAASLTFGALWATAGVHTAFVVFAIGLSVALAATVFVLLLRPRGRAAAAA